MARGTILGRSSMAEETVEGESSISPFLDGNARQSPHTARHFGLFDWERPTSEMAINDLEPPSRAHFRHESLSSTISSGGYDSTPSPSSTPNFFSSRPTLTRPTLSSAGSSRQPLTKAQMAHSNSLTTSNPDLLGPSSSPLGSPGEEAGPPLESNRTLRQHRDLEDVEDLPPSYKPEWASGSRER